MLEMRLGRRERKETLWVSLNDVCLVEGVRGVKSPRTDSILQDAGKNKVQLMQKPKHFPNVMRSDGHASVAMPCLVASEFRPLLDKVPILPIIPQHIRSPATSQSAYLHRLG